MIAIAALLSWAATAGLGSWMLTRWLRHGGLARLRADRDRLGPLVITGHFSLALTGLAAWAVFVAGRWPAAAWTAVSLLALAVGLGLSTVTLWTPYPARGAAGIRGPEPAAGAAAGPDQGTGGTGQPGPPGVIGGGPAGDVPLAGPVTDAMLTRALTDETLLGLLVADVVARSAEHPEGQPGAPAQPAGPAGGREPLAWPGGPARLAGSAQRAGPARPGRRG